MSELIARLERAFFALTKPMATPALPAPDRQQEIDALRAEVDQAKADRQSQLAQQGLTRAALKSAHDDVEVRDARIAELTAALELAHQERDEARIAVGDQADRIETLLAALEAAATHAHQAAANAGPGPDAIDAAALEAIREVGGSLEYVASERLVEYVHKVFALLQPANMVEGTDNADPSV